MPEGSSSDAPVIRPGPKCDETASTFLGDPDLILLTPISLLVRPSTAAVRSRKSDAMNGNQKKRCDGKDRAIGERCGKCEGARLKPAVHNIFGEAS
jgi:hypothetical protein